MSASSEFRPHLHVARHLAPDRARGGMGDPAGDILSVRSAGDGIAKRPCRYSKSREGLPGTAFSPSSGTIILPGRYWRQIVPCHPRTCHIAGDQQRNEDHGRTKAGTDQAEEDKAGTVVRHLKLPPNQLHAKPKGCPAESVAAYHHPRSAVAEIVPGPTCRTICLRLPAAL